MVLVCTSILPIKVGAQRILSVDGRDEFQNVEYVGGDATQQKSRSGWLVVTDSTLSIHRCRLSGCLPHDKNRYYEEVPDYQIPLRTITEVTSSSQVRGPSTGSRIALGVFAGDRSEEFVGIIYETESSAEAPVFRTKQAQSAALEAKLRFRLKRLGVELTPTPASDEP
jgi:hypothetical protein